MSLPLQYTVLCLGSDLSHLLWTALFLSFILGLYFPPLAPLKFLFMPSSFIYLRMSLFPVLMCTYFSLYYVAALKYICLVDL